EPQGVHIFKGRLVSPSNPNIPQIGKVPRLRQLLAVMIVDVIVLAVDPGNDRRHAPLIGKAIVERREYVAIERLHLIVVLRNFPDADVLRARARLVLTDVLVAQVSSPAGFCPDSLSAPVGV